MKKIFLILTIACSLLACSTDDNKNSEMNALLTDTRWTIPEDFIGNKKMIGTWSFNADGTYIEDFDKTGNAEKITMKGSWKWISKTEIALTYQTIAINGKVFDLDYKENEFYILRVKELTGKDLKVIKRFNGDAESSSFAKEVAYIAEGM